MKVNVKLDVSKVTFAIDELKKKLPQEISRALIRTANYGIRIIQKRTLSGSGYEGKFQPYTPKYAKFKLRYDRSGIVNLNYRGTMQSSMAARMIRKNVAQIYFTRATEAKKAAMNNELRPWFGFNRSEQNTLSNYFVRQFK
tara:strand:- start:45 stop:467 length:423 start_codon:yes stop_codon:yes gene_type:complete